MKSGVVKGVVLLLVAVALVLGGMYAGRKTYKPSVRWLSQLSGEYPIDKEFHCKNGQSLGRVQADLDLTNGKWTVLRNDPGKYPKCP
jgi:hypothetical protein